MSDDNRRKLRPLGEAAQILGYSKASLYRFAAEGRIELLRIGDRTFVAEDEVDRFIADEARPFAPRSNVIAGGAGPVTRRRLRLERQQADRAKPARVAMPAPRARGPSPPGLRGRRKHPADPSRPVDVAAKETPGNIVRAAGTGSKAPAIGGRGEPRADIVGVVGAGAARLRSASCCSDSPTGPARARSQAWPSVASICEDTGLSERSVRKALGDLRTRRLIEVVHPSRRWDPPVDVVGGDVAGVRPAPRAPLDGV